MAVKPKPPTPQTDKPKAEGPKEEEGISKAEYDALPTDAERDLYEEKPPGSGKYVKKESHSM